MPEYAIFRMEKPAPNIVVSRTKHHLRLCSPANADPARADQNKVICNACEGDFATWADAEIRKRVTGRIQKNSVRCVELLLTRSPEWQGSDEEWVVANRMYLERTFGGENIGLATCHFDEKTTHIHAFIVPITTDGRLSASDWFDGRKKMSARQDEYANSMASLGLARGTRGSIRKHIPPAQFRSGGARLDMAIQEAAEAIRFADNTEKKAEKIRDKIAHFATSEPLMHQAQRATESAAENKAEADRLRKAEADRLRQISVLALARKRFGTEYAKQGENYLFRSDGHKYSVLADGKYCDLITGNGGNGAISFIRTVENVDYIGAIAILKSEKVPTQDIVLTVARGLENKAKELVDEAQKETKQDRFRRYVQPSAEPAHVAKAKHYLTMERGLDKALIDNCFQAGTICANQYGSAVFVEPNGACIIRGTCTDGEPYHAKHGEQVPWFHGKKSATKIVVAESPIDALSLTEYDDAAVVATGGAHDAKKLVLWLKSTFLAAKQYLSAFDHDRAGMAFHAAFHKLCPCVRWIPKNASSKDPNADLLAAQKQVYAEEERVYEEDTVEKPRHSHRMGL